MSSSRTARARQWIEEFLVLPHPELGRSGDVCPFMSRAIRDELVTIEPFPATAGPVAFTHFARAQRDLMLDRARRLDERHRAYLATVLVPSGLPDERLRELVADVQSALKGEFVEHGLMIGEFWPHHTGTGLHNEAFRPLAAPLPLLAMRHMVQTDLAFLSGPHVPPGEQRTYLAHYRRVFAGRLTGRWQEKVLDAQRLAAGS